MSDEQLIDTVSEDAWVTVTEAMGIIDYSRDGLVYIIRRNSKKPEAERDVRIRKRSHAWEIWLPDLISLLDKPGHGPYSKRKKQAT